MMADCYAFQPVSRFREGDEEEGRRQGNTHAGFGAESAASACREARSVSSPEELGKPQSQFIHCSVVCWEEEGSPGRLQAPEQNSSSCHSGSHERKHFTLASCTGRLPHGAGVPVCHPLLGALTEVAGNLFPVMDHVPLTSAWKLAWWGDVTQHPSGGSAVPHPALARHPPGESPRTISSRGVGAKAPGGQVQTEPNGTNNGTNRNIYWREALWDIEVFTRRGEDSSLPQDLRHTEFFRSKISFSLGGRKRNEHRRGVRVPEFH